MLLSLVSKPKKLINCLIDSLATIRYLCTLMYYVANRSEGLKYTSYGVADEVSLALSFADRAWGGVVIDAGASKGDWSRLFLSCKPYLEKLIIVEP